MNKELYVSSTPHETKVGLVEDDLLAEVYLERENEYTLAGSIYKGRVTRVLPGMQSAFVDIGLERDAFLYVSDFMELEEHDEDQDLTEVVPVSRGVQDLRRQPARVEEGSAPTEAQGASDAHEGHEAGEEFEASGAVAGDVEGQAEGQGAQGAAPESASAGDQNRERGGYRGRRRRRGGRRDGRSEGDRGNDRNRGESRDNRETRDRAPEMRFSRPASEVPVPRSVESVRSQPSGPPAGYQPILLPGESISKYQRYAQQAVSFQEPARADVAHEPVIGIAGPAVESTAPVTASFPEDEPIFAAGAAVTEPLHEQHGDSQPVHEEPVESASTSLDWNREFRRPEQPSAPESVFSSETRNPVEQENEAERDQEAVQLVSEYIESEPSETEPVESLRVESVSPQEPPAFAAPGTMEEETIDEEEADTIRYETSSDEGYEEFEEETSAAGQTSSSGQINGDAREAVSEIHLSSLTDASGVPAAEAAPAEGEEDSEELELEEAQAEAEALLDAEARSNGTVDARAEVRAPAATAGYTQRTQRPAPGFDRRNQRGRRPGARRFRRRESAPVPQISDLLKEGQEILVQIAKEPIGKKGARITSHIALPGRFLVYMPTVNHTGVSRKIASDEERQRLKRIILSERENGHGGFIVRTAAQNASEEELRADIRFLKGLWSDIKTRSESSKPPALIYHDLNVVERVLRDQVTSDFSVIWVDTETEYERILRFFNRFQPAMVKRVKLYTKETPLFEQFGLAEEMNKALKSKVWLKSGGYIVINQTEALVAIDINTGKYVGKTARLEDTIVKTNVDAIKEIVRQIRLRDLGGIIIIDFIDMDERRNRQRVMQALEEELRHDRAPSKTLQFNDFGLVAITRKRVKQSLERTIGAPCPYCQSTGYVKSVATICNEIYVEMRKIAKHLEHQDVMLRVNPDVAKELKTNNGRLLNEMEELTKRTVIVKSDAALHQEQFDIN
jgi:Rne/Rng family ribonuclease